VALGMPWKHEHVIFLGGTFFFEARSKERKEVWRGGASLRKQGRGTETYGNSTCFPIFPKHVPGTLRENPSLKLFPTQDVSKTCSILFSAKFEPISNLFRDRAQ